MQFGTGLPLLVAFGVIVFSAALLWIRDIFSLRDERRREALAAQVTAMLARRARASSLPQSVPVGSDFVAYFNDALARRKARDYEGARRSIEAALFFNRHHAPAYLLRGELRSLARDARGAIDDYTKGIALVRPDAGGGPGGVVRAALAEAHYQRARAYLDVGEHDAARDDLAKAHDLGHDSAGGALHILERARRSAVDGYRARQLREQAS